MVSTLVSGPTGPGSSPGRGHCVVFLGKPLHPGVLVVCIENKRRNHSMNGI